MKKILFVITILLSCSAAFAVTVTIDVNQDRTAISPYIYGVNIYGNSDDPATYPYLDPSINWGSRRLGGNRATGYNWENNASNAGADYNNSQSDGWWCTVYGTADCNAPGALVGRFVNDCNARGWEPLVTAQMAGFAAADKLGTSVLETAVAGLTSDRWKTVQFAKGSAFSLNPNTADEYVYMDEFVNWMVNQFGGSGNANGVKMISLDNEPTLWYSTHPRIHPTPVTYAELKDETIALAQAIKNVDPGVELFGAVDFGWSAFQSLNSAVDAATEGAGYAWFIDYYLDKLEAASASYGNRLLDVLDIHWYPEDNGNNCRIVYTQYDGDCSDPTDYSLNSVARMNAPRCLWDPSYTEDSWIPSPIRLIPRLQDSINSYYPGTKIAITEYDFGGGTHYSAGIAEADALGVMGKYGVYAAYLWDITPGSYTIAGVKLFRNYDGSLSTYGDTNVRAVSGDTANMPVYASQNASDPSKLHIIAINRSSSAQTANISITGPYGFSTGRVWAFDSAGYAITERTNIPSITGNAFSYSVPAYTAMHMVLTSNMLTPTFTQTLNPLWTKTSTPTVSPTRTATPLSILLDDCEDGNNSNNWNGAWYRYVDSAGSTLTPVSFAMTAGGVTGSTSYMAEITGIIAPGGYGGMGTNLNSGGTAVDMTGYTGVEFWLKGSGSVWFQLTQSAITGSYFGKAFTASSTWTKVTVMFATDLTQRYGGPGTFTLDQIIALQWATNGEGAFDFQVDDVRLIPASAPGTATPTASLTHTRTRTMTSTPASTVTHTGTMTRTVTRTYTRTITGTSTPSATRTATCSSTSTATNPPIITNTFTVSSTATRTPTPTLTLTSNFSPSYTATATGTPTRTCTPTTTGTRTAAPTLTLTSNLTLTYTATDTPTRTGTPTNTGSATRTASTTATTTHTPVNTGTRTASVTPTNSRTGTSTSTPVYSPTGSNTGTPPTGTVTPSVTSTFTFTRSVTESSTATFSPSTSATASPVNTFTITGTASYTTVVSATPTSTATLVSSATSSPTLTLTYNLSPSFTATATGTEQGTFTRTLTPSIQPSFTSTVTLTAVPSATYTPTGTPTAAGTCTATISRTYTGTPTLTGTPTALPTATATFAEADSLEITELAPYPNPYNPSANGSLAFSFETNRRIDAYSMDIYTPSFRLIYRESAAGVNFYGKDTVSVPAYMLGSLAAGTYYCVLSGSGGGREARSKPAVLIILR